MGGVFNTANSIFLTSHPDFITTYGALLLDTTSMKTTIQSEVEDLGYSKMLLNDSLSNAIYQILGTQNLVLQCEDVVGGLEKFHFSNLLCSAVLLYCLIIEIGAVQSTSQFLLFL